MTQSAQLYMQIIVALLLLALYARVRPGWRRTGPFLPDAFILGLLFYTCGAIWVLAFEPVAASAEVAAMALTALASGSAGATVYCLATAQRYDEDFLQFIRSCKSGPLERAAIHAGLLVAFLACILFIYLVFRTDAIAALLGIGSMATDLDLLKARVTISSGSETYLAPGYFKQFRDILLPILLASLIILDRKHLRSLPFWVCFSVALLALMISGQRLVVVVFLLTLMFASHYSRAARHGDGSSQRRLRIRLLPLAFVVVGYGLLTALLGRLRDDATGLGATFNVAGNFLDRVFLAAPRENAITHPIWSESGPTGGISWLNDLSGVLPGVEESLSNVLHMATGGSAAGNSPLGLPADTWLAWGWPGLLLIPALFAIGVGLLDLACHLRRSPILAGLRFHLFLVLPVCYSPFIFFLYGGAVAIALLLLVAMLRSHSVQPGSLPAS